MSLASTPRSLQTVTVRMVTLFVGDGNYKGDGGGMLQQLWSGYNWRPLRNCPGRYSMITGGRESELAKICPHMVVKRALNGFAGCKVDTFSVPNKDPVVLVRFEDGGALLSYSKKVACNAGSSDIRYEKNEKSSANVSARRSSYTYVHTLNTESGLCRKMAALQLTFQISTSKSSILCHLT